MLTTYALEAKKNGTRQVRGVQGDARRCGSRSTSGSRAKGIEITPQVYDGAGELIDEQLGYEIARYVFGRPAEFRRRAQDDKQMQTAMGLLRKAGSPRELMSLATSNRAAVPAQN